MALHLVLLGPPASGKGTQGRRLAEREALPYLSTGALLRETAAGRGEAAGVIREALANGEYVDDGVMCGIMDEWLGHHPDGWVLDGFPRTIPQDDFLRGWLEARDRRVDAAVSLEVPKDVLIRRIENRVECAACRWTGQREELGAGDACPKCGEKAGRRGDDTLENFLRRYAEFEEHTVPVIERYEARGLLHACDATRGIDEVADRIEDSLKPLRQNGQTA